MAEIIAKVGPDRGIELVEHRSGKAHIVGLMTPEDGAYLARGILGCAAALCGPSPPEFGTVIADAQLPVMKWVVESSAVNGDPVLTVTIPSGIELTFHMPRNSAREIGVALVTQGEGSVERRSGAIH
jgi:hypothetical protein